MNADTLMKEEKQKNKSFLKKKLWPFIVSLSGAVVMALAFFIPSVQDQWDRYQSRKIIEQYVDMGNDLFSEGRYKMAEDAYAKAYELSLDTRLDIEVKRLNAKINRINENPEWGSKPPEDLEEVDFQFLLHLQKGKDHEKERVSTLNCYGVFLANHGRVKESKAVFDEALQLDPTELLAYINLGNLYDQEGKKSEAEKAYKKALSLNPQDTWAHYNLGLLFFEQNKLPEAEKEFSKAKELEPEDPDVLKQYNLVVEASKKTSADNEKIK